jgi:hypothetical protein
VTVAPVVDDDRQQAFLAGLTKEERLLVAIRDELYGGSWDEVVVDLEARKNRKPFILKLASRIDEDIARIDKLRAFEREHACDLRALLAGQGGDEEVGRGT